MTIGKIKKNFPHPFAKKSEKKINDPQYQLQIPQNQLSDHFYDTGIYRVEWKFSKYWKTNHPFMGKMSFPENENKTTYPTTEQKITLNGLVFKISII